MSLRARAITLLATLVVLLGATILSVFDALDRLRAQTRLASDDWQPANAQVRSLLTSLVDQENGERGFVITGDPAFLEPYRRGERDADRILTQLARRFPTDRNVQDQIRMVRRAVVAWRSEAAAPEISARRSGQVAAAQELVAAGVGKRLFDRVRGEVARLQARIDARALAAGAAAGDDLRLLRLTVAGWAVLTMGLVVVATVLMRWWVLTPVHRLRSSMRQVAEGDLEHRVLVPGPPEIAAIAADAEAMRRRIVTELEAARSAAEGLEQQSPLVAGIRAELHEPSASEVHGLSVAGAVKPAEGVLAGDWWQAVPRPNGKVAVTVTDVSGHGAAAGLVALRFKQRLNALLRTDLALQEAFTIAANDLDEDPERLLTCLVVEVDPGSRALAIINAGHPPCLLARRYRGRVTVRDVAPTGPLVGAISTGWGIALDRLDADELLVIVTDGVLEARAQDGREFGLAGVINALTDVPAWSPEAAVSECIEAVRRFASDWRRDDVTCVALASPMPH